MNQQFLTSFSIIVIQHVQNQFTFTLGNQSFTRNQVFLTKNSNSKKFQNSLFYVQIQGNDKQFNVAIEFQDRIMLRHKLSNKYLSFSSEFQQQQNDTTYRLQLSQTKCYFKIFPCFQYQTKISSKIKFGEDIYIGSAVNSQKLGYISGRTNSETKRTTVLGLNYKSKLLLHNYYEYEKEQTCYTFGSIIWLTHIQCSNFLTINQYKQNPLIMFQPLQLDQNLQSITGLWLIQSEQYQTGGKICFEQKFTLKNLHSGYYLSLNKDFKLVQKQKVYQFNLQSKPSQYSKFVFKSLTGEDNRIKKGSYLKFFNSITNCYIGCRKRNFKQQTVLSNPLLYYDFSDQDLFKIIQVSEHQSQAIRFIFSVKQQLKSLDQKLSFEQISTPQYQQILQLYENIQKELNNLSRFDDIYLNVQKQLIKCVEDLSRNNLKFKKIYLTLSKKNKNQLQNYKFDSKQCYILKSIIKASYQIMRLICLQNRQNQQISWKYIHFFIQDFFQNVGSQELLITIFSNNYTLLCKVPDSLPNLSNNNVVKTIITFICNIQTKKDDNYWINIQKIIKLFMTFIYLNNSTIDINQRLLSEVLFEDKTFDKVFFSLKITGQRIKVDGSLINNSKNSKSNLIDIEQIESPLFLNIIQSIFQLFSSLCSNRNLISKKAINYYLNHDNKQGTSILISYLDIPISKRLLNHLYGLITNLYIDSCPRINRYKPLAIINFVLEQDTNQTQDDQITSQLRQVLLRKVEESYRSRPLFITNLLNITLSFQPTLTPQELEQYKDQIHNKMNSSRWSVQMLDSLRILIELESFHTHQIIDVFNMISSKIQSQIIPIHITISILRLINQILLFSQQLELKKTTCYLKYKFKQKKLSINKSDIAFMLPLSKRINKIFKQKKIKVQDLQSEMQSSTKKDDSTINQYNKIQQTLSKLSPSSSLKQKLFQMFIQFKLQQQYQQKTAKVIQKQQQSQDQLPQKVLISKNSAQNLQYSKSLFKTLIKFNRPRYYYLKILMNTIFITKDQTDTFDQLFNTYKSLKHLISISEYWLCNTKNQQDLDKFLHAIDKLINYFYDGFSFSNKAIHKKDYLSININRQLVIRNLGIHIIIFQLLQTNFYLLQKPLIPKYLTVFQKSFQFLNHFIHDCTQNKTVIYDYWNVLDQFINLREVGQTPLYINMIGGNINYIKEVKQSFIEKIIQKVVAGSNISNDQNAVKASAHKNNTSDHISQSQFNPELIRFLQVISVVDQQGYKPNLEIIFKLMEKQWVLKKIFFVTQNKNQWKFCLDVQKINITPLQIPYLYHAQLLKIINLILQYLDYASMGLKNRLQNMFSIDYLLSILHDVDIFSHTGIKAQLNFLLKKQLIKLLLHFLQKNDAFLKYYQNENLSKLLSFYGQIFIKRQQRKAIYFQNQSLYFPYVNKYKSEIDYYVNNQRNYYLDYVKPLLLKLIKIYEKLSSRQTNKNYQFLVYLVQNIRLQNLSHNFDSQKTKYNIDSVEIKWRNFVDKDENNGLDQKFAKQSILQVLRNPQTIKILAQQQKQFFLTIKQNYRKYISSISQLLQLLIQEQSTQSNQTIYDIYQILRNLKQYLSSLSPEEVDQLTFTLEECFFIQKLIQFCNRTIFQFNKQIFKQIFYQILAIFNLILVNDQELRINKIFYKQFQDNLLSYRFFALLNLSILQINLRVQRSKFVQHVNHALSSLYLCVQERQMSLDKQALRFITQLCSYMPFTSFLRFQPLYPSIDFLQKVYNSLTFILYQQQQNIKINVSIVDTAQQILQCISSMLTGANKMNQNYIIDNKFPQILNSVLKIESLEKVNQQNLGMINQRDRLLEEVIQFYQANGIDIARILQTQITIIDFKHIYVLNRLKQSLLRTLTQCIAGNQRAFAKIKIQIPIQFLKINIIWIYQDFKQAKFSFTEDLVIRKRQPWDVVIEDKNLNGLFLMIGFYFFMLIQSYSALDKQNGQDDSNESANDNQKNKQKLIKKFFNSISQTQKKDDKMKSLEKQPFAQQMKKFYQQYYESIEFFKQYSLTIEVNLLGSLAKIYFPRLPLCQKLSEQRIELFKSQADRISQEQKIKSLLEFAQQIYEQLQGEQDFFTHYSQKYPYFAIFLKSLKYQSEFLFIAWVLAVILTLLFLLNDFSSPAYTFSSQLWITPSTVLTTLMFVISMCNCYLALCLFIYLFARKIPMGVRLLKGKFAEEEITQGIYQYELVYIIGNIVSEVFYVFFVGVCLVCTFLHPLFAGFLLTEILNRIQIGKQIIKSIKQTWFQLFVAICLLVITNFLYSTLMYVMFYVPYGPVCTQLYNCLLYLIDQSLKADSGFLSGGPPIYPDENGSSSISFRFICEMFYVVFAKKVIFEIFSGTIIDKFSQLRQQTAKMQEDQDSVCFICGQQRFTIDFELEGFQTHIQETHNKINYIFYIFYLKRLERQNYGIVEKYIEQCQMKDKKDWIPNQTSILKEQKHKNQSKQEDDDKEQLKDKQYQKKLQQLKKLKQKTQIMINQMKNRDQV